MKIFSRCMLITVLLPGCVAAEGFASSAQLQSLFTTPAERQQLNSMRDAGKYAGGMPVQSSSKPTYRAPLKVEMRGIMIKNGDKPVVWVNQGNTLKSTTIEEGVRVNPQQMDAASKQVPVRIFNRTYRMKPGEVWTETDNRVEDAYQIKPEDSKSDGME